MVKSSLFSDNDLRILDHLPRAHHSKGPFRNDMVRRQARSRLRRKIEKEAAPFLASHLYEWQAIRTAYDYGLVDEAVRENLQDQIWGEKDALIGLILEWLPEEKHAEFLESLYNDKYLDEATEQRDKIDPLAPTRFLGPYLDRLRMYDPEAEEVRKRLVYDLAMFQELTGSKHPLVKFSAGDSDDKDLVYHIWTLEPLDFEHLRTYERSEDRDTFVYIVPASMFN
jgi:hypothetical protein